MFERMMEVDEVKEAGDTYYGQLALHAKRRAALHSVPSILPREAALTSWWSDSRAIPRFTSIFGEALRTI